MKSKKLRYRLLAIIIIPLVIVIILLGFYAYSSLRNLTHSGGTSEPSMSIESYGYYLRNDATELQEELFNELNEALNSEEEDEGLISSLVVENFVADFYTWTNKYGQYDVGGLYFIYDDLRLNTQERARDDFYKYFNYYLDLYSKSNLIEVESVEATSGTRISGGYTLDDNTSFDDAYYVKCEFTYKNSRMDTSNLVTSLNFTVVRNDSGRYEIVQIYGDDYGEE